MAFKNLLGGIRWKYDLNKYNFPSGGYCRVQKYIMPTPPVNIIYIHKLECKGLLRVTIFPAPERFSRGVIRIDRELEKTVNTLLLKMLTKMGNSSKKFNRRARAMYKDSLNGMELLLDGKPVDKDVHCSTIFDLDGQLSFKIFDVDYFCAVNEPFVDFLKIHDTPVSGTFHYPLQVNAFSTHKLDFKWFRSELTNDEENWTQIGEGSHYLVQDDDVSHYLKLECVPSNARATGLPVVVKTANVVQPQLCSYYYLNTHKFTKEEVKEDMFRLVTYNVLANYFATTKEGKKMFDYCPKEAMSMNQRFSAIAIELLGYNSDVICLQEVDVDVYNIFWRPLFESLDWNCNMGCGVNSPQGTVCFYRDRKFKLLHSGNYNFACEITENPALKDILLYIQNNVTLYEKCTSLKHAVQLIALESKIKTNEVLVIGNLHLYSHPQGGEIRIMQVAATFKLLNCILRQLESSLLNKSVSIILCGDFNSVPSSCVHDFVKNSISDATWVTNENVNPLTVFGHTLKMESAYKTPLLTNYTRDFQGCLDYIYYEKDRLEVDKVYPTASEEILSANTGIPSVSFPSDHLPLIADFKWKS